MEDNLAEITDLFISLAGKAPYNIEKLPPSGGDRAYFRIFSDSETYIATQSPNVAENKAFLYCTRHFLAANIPVPEILAANKSLTTYIQRDLGQLSLLDSLEKNSYSPVVYDLYNQAISTLSRMQVQGDKDFDYSQSLVAGGFDRQAILNDLYYFKYYFLDTLKLPYNKQALQTDFDTLSAYLSSSSHTYFMYRDFQARNILVNEGNVSFIDYQGGMKGPLQYDVASLLWQAKANLPEEWKKQLLEAYIGETEKNLQVAVDRTAFISFYNGFVLLRLLQVLGAYGFRGLFERKSHFIDSIPQALKNLGLFAACYHIDVDLPALTPLLTSLSSAAIMSIFDPIKADENTALVVKIYSFSYKQNLPADDTENGGGFLFDMRGILNPGRFAEYKKLTGRDTAVIDFLEQKTNITAFLANAFNMVDVNVADYIQRGFNSLLVGFGCTGGQHRSVYAADKMAAHLQHKFGVKTIVYHLVQDKKNWIN